jgi:hypothetical protein
MLPKREGHQSPSTAPSLPGQPGAPRVSADLIAASIYDKYSINSYQMLFDND